MCGDKAVIIMVCRTPLLFPFLLMEGNISVEYKCVCVRVCVRVFLFVNVGNASVCCSIYAGCIALPQVIDLHLTVDKSQVNKMETELLVRH